MSGVTTSVGNKDWNSPTSYCSFCSLQGQVEFESNINLCSHVLVKYTTTVFPVLTQYSHCALVSSHRVRDRFPYWQKEENVCISSLRYVLCSGPASSALSLQPVRNLEPCSSVSLTTCLSARKNIKNTGRTKNKKHVRYSVSIMFVKNSKQSTSKRKINW